MSPLHVAVEGTRCRFTVAGERFEAPVGPATLAEVLTCDPPLPEELTNAIGIAADHVDDLLRLMPDATAATPVVVCGDDVHTVASVELGRTASLPFVLSRDAAEDVFRTVATERHAARALNPGLPAHLTDTIVATCCLLVGFMRHLHLDEVVVDRAPATAGGTGQDVPAP